VALTVSWNGPEWNKKPHYFMEQTGTDQKNLTISWNRLEEIEKSHYFMEQTEKPQY